MSGLLFVIATFLFLFILTIVIVTLASAFNRIPENENWVVTRMGKTEVKGPGSFVQIPILDEVKKVDMREIPTKVQDRACITKDMAHIIIHMVVYSRVIDPLKYASRTGQSRVDLVPVSSSVLKGIVSSLLLDEVISGRDQLGSTVCERLNRDLDPALGLRIENVKLDVVVPKEGLASMSGTPASAPATCPACGAPLPKARGLKGKDQVTCEYCGYVIKL